MRALLVYPEMPPTYWGMKYAMPFIGKGASIPPLGLLTIGAMLPADWELSLVDCNVEPLGDAALAAADLVLVSAMMIQKSGFDRIVRAARRLGKTVVAGGPYPSACQESIAGVDHFVLGEAEVTLPAFLADLERGSAAPVYQDPARPDLTSTPPPRFDLIDTSRYATMALQFSRGCPHSCEFCDVIELFGRVPRAKSPRQFVAELDALHAAGWRGSVFVVDDNFIANVARVRALLPEIAAWQQRHGSPFRLFTEATLGLAEDEPLMDAMVDAGFNMVFLGIETPDADTLRAAGKRHNLRRDMLDSVRSIQRKGMEVTGGFIVGFDTDREDIFDRQLRFIHDAAIPTAMVGLLTAMPNTQLHKRLEAEGRLVEISAGNNTHDLRLNFVPRMDLQALLAGYTRVLAELYTPERYFARCLALLRSLTPHPMSARRVSLVELRAFVLSLLVQGFSRYSWSYWRFLMRGFRARPRLLAETVTMAVKGHHFFKITRNLLELDALRRMLDELTQSIEGRAQEALAAGRALDLAELGRWRDRAVWRARTRMRRLHRDFRDYAEEAIAEFQRSADELVARLAAARPLAENQRA